MVTMTGSNNYKESDIRIRNRITKTKTTTMIMMMTSTLKSDDGHNQKKHDNDDVGNNRGHTTVRMCRFRQVS